MKALTKRQAKHQVTDAALVAQSQTMDIKPTNKGVRAQGWPPRGKENVHQICTWGVKVHSLMLT